MNHFEIGVVSFVLAALFPVAYFTGFQLRRLGAWSKREAAPKDRVGFFLLVALIFGFGLGSFAQPLWTKGVNCKATGQAVVPCVIFTQP